MFMLSLMLVHPAAVKHFRQKKTVQSIRLKKTYKKHCTETEKMVKKATIENHIIVMFAIRVICWDNFYSFVGRFIDAIRSYATACVVLLQPTHHSRNTSLN
jgi:hypothetical protein